MRPILLIVLSLISITVLSQNASVKGKISVIVNIEQQSKIEGASVELLQQKDSALVKAALSNKEGLAEFDNIKSGDYFVRVSMLNYTTVYSEIFSVSQQNQNISLPSIQLSATSNQLQNVT